MSSKKQGLSNTVRDLHPADYNPRTISDAKLKILAKTMKEYGDLSGIIVNKKTGNLIGGHQRLKNLDPSWRIVKLPHKDKIGTVATGYIETPMGRWVYREVEWSVKKELAANLAANNPAGGWDFPRVKDMLVELDDGAFDLELTGFSPEELEQMFGDDGRKGKTEDDHIPPIPIKAKSKPGEIYLMGRHRLMCGSSTDPRDIDRLMDGDHADMVWTDPPYNVDYEGTAGKIKNDNMSAGKFYAFLEDTLASMSAILRPGGCFYIAHAEGNEMSAYLRRQLQEHKTLMAKQCIIWVKNAPVLGRQDYNWKHEPILYGWKEGAAHYFNEDYTQTTVIDDDIDLRKLGKSELITLVNTIRNAIPTSVIRENKPPKSDLHPTQKPVELVARNITASSRPREIVVDLFGGSGTTLIAAEKTDRIAYLMEMDPRFVDVIVKRWEDWTGRKAEKQGVAHGKAA